MQHYLTAITDKLDHPSAGGVLILAGLLPTILSTNFLSAVYFALLIPPAAYHCYVQVRTNIWPAIKSHFTKNSQ